MYSTTTSSSKSRSSETRCEIQGRKTLRDTLVRSTFLLKEEGKGDLDSSLRMRACVS